MYAEAVKELRKAQDEVEALKNKCTFIAFEIATARTSEEEKNLTRTWEKIIEELRTAVETKDRLWKEAKHRTVLDRLQSELAYWEKQWSIAEDRLSELEEKSAKTFRKLVEIRQEIETYKSENGLI